LKSLHSPQPCSLFIAILSSQLTLIDQTLNKFAARFGPVELTLNTGIFTHSEYYKQEMGTDLERVFCCFKPPFNEDTLKNAKLFARSLEWEHASITNQKIRRKLNIDPGIVSLSRVVLSTSKNYAHRLYVGDGVYAEVTLIYREEGWQLLPWTYPDYQQIEVQSFLLNCRRSLHHYINSIRGQCVNFRA
jgi:hypothetical protein